MLAACRTLTLPGHADARGAMAWLGPSDLPFRPFRAYWLWDWQHGQARGVHAHRRLHQLYVALQGTLVVHLDDGAERRDVVLSRPDEGLLLVPMIWRSIDAVGPGAVLLAFADGPHDEDEIIRDRSVFLREACP